MRGKAKATRVIMESSTHMLKRAVATPAMARIATSDVKKMVQHDKEELSLLRSCSANWASAKLMDAAAVTEWMGISSPILTKSDMTMIDYCCCWFKKQVDVFEFKDHGRMMLASSSTVLFVLLLVDRWEVLYNRLERN